MGCRRANGFTWLKMKKRLYGIITILFSVSWALAQTPEEERFDRAFLRIYTHTASENVGTALKSADSLYRAAASDVQRIRSLMLISDMHHRSADRDSSIHYAIKAEEIAERTNNYLWQARICGVLSTQYRETGLFSAGRRYVDKGLTIIEKVDNLSVANQFRGQCLQELGFYDLEEKRYSAAIANFRSAEQFFIGLTDTLVRNAARAQNDERLGLCYLESGTVDSAEFYYRRALSLERKVSGKTGTPVKGFIYNGLGRVHLANKHYGQADSCFQQALVIAEATGLPNLQISVYKALAAYYRLTGNDDGYRQYNDKYLKTVQENTSRHQRYTDHILAQIQRQLFNMSAVNRVLAVSTFILVLFGGAGAGVYMRRHRKNHRRYQAIIQTLKRDRMQAALGEKATTIVSEMDRDKEIMPEGTKQDLLRKLDRFESSRQFTDRNISIAVLAGKMKTNTKYLSYIINNYRNKDFNSYINELRINYIIGKMEADSRYLNYKISYLAEECGFATHSQFATVFKNITGLSPSTFITYLKKEERVEAEL